jgi:hypothetical protein
MKLSDSRKIQLLRISYWLGAILDALAFIQMAFPEIGKKMLGVTRELTPEYIFAVNLGAGLMFAWTLLLIWADRKPLERRMIIPLTMLIIIWNICTLTYGIQKNILPIEKILPQIVIYLSLFIYYGFCFILTYNLKNK